MHMAISSQSRQCHAFEGFDTGWPFRVKHTGGKTTAAICGHTMSTAITLGNAITPCLLKLCNCNWTSVEVWVNVSQSSDFQSSSVFRWIVALVSVQYAIVLVCSCYPARVFTVRRGFLTTHPIGLSFFSSHFACPEAVAKEGNAWECKWLQVVARPETFLFEYHSLSQAIILRIVTERSPFP